MFFDLIIVVLMVLFAAMGWKKGFIRSVYSILSLALSMLLVYMLRDIFVEAIAASPIGDAISEFLTKQTDAELARQCSSAVISVISVFILYYLVRFLLRTTIGLLDFVAKLPLINSLNCLLGLAFGAAGGALWVIMLTNVGYFVPQLQQMISESYIVAALGLLVV